jgi:hypothetical protein
LVYSTQGYQLNPVANADPFTDTWEWVEEHPDIGVPALFIDAPMMVFIAAVTDPETDVQPQPPSTYYQRILLTHLFQIESLVPLQLIVLLLSPALNNPRPKRVETMHNLLP